MNFLQKYGIVEGLPDLFMNACYVKTAEMGVHVPGMLDLLIYLSRFVQTNFIWLKKVVMEI